MSLRRAVAGVAVVALVSSLTAVLGQAPAALAQGPRPAVIPIAGAVDVVADPVTQRVFVSTGTEGLVRVFTWGGAVVGDVTLGRPLGMDLDPTTGQVFVANGADSMIVAIDTTTLTKTVYGAAGSGCPNSVAVMGDVVWFGYAPSGCKGTGGVGYLDLSASPPTAALTDADISRPLVGGTAGVLELFARDQSPMNSQTWLVTGGQHQMVAFSPDTGSTGSDIAATPDATEVVLATAGGHQGYDPLTFDPGTTYPTSSPYGASADFGADGSLLATGSSRSLRVFPRGSETPIAEWSVGDAVLDTSLVPGGLAMGGTSRVFALTEASSGVGPRYLVIYTLGSDSPSALALDPVRSGEIGSEVTISGRLLGASVPADQVVSVRRIDPAGSPSAGATVDLGTAPVAADGSFSFGDTPTDAGFTRYVVRWEGRQGGFGASGADPAESAIAVDVRRHPTTLTLDLDAQRYGADELMTATIVHDDDALYPGSVTLYREDPWGDRFEVGSGTMVAGEPLVLQVPPVASGRLVAEYAGSETGDKSRVASDPYTVIPVVRGIVRTAYDVRGDTWFVAPRDTPRVRWRVKPTPFAQCSSLTLQQETRAGWQRLRHSDCVYLLSNGPTTPLKRDHAEGDRWRVRVTVGETPTHESGASPWVYITFRKPPQ